MIANRGDLTEKDIELLLRPFVIEADSAPNTLYAQLQTYLHLLLKWNSRTNLTAIRVPEEIVLRHFGESLFAAQHLGQSDTLLDFGSGAGFPGLPIHLFLPDLRVTLAESQNKKTAFLREAVRTLGLKTEIWDGRVEIMPATQRFDVVTLRAVDNMDAALISAAHRANRRILLLTTRDQAHPVPTGFSAATPVPLPGATNRQILLLERVADLKS